MKETEKFILNLNNQWQNFLPIITKDFECQIRSNYQEIDFKNIIKLTFPDTFGIYLFQVFPYKSFDIEKFKENWVIENKSVSSPRIIKSRLLIDQSRDWHPFYLGKAENIHKRINEHCLQEKHKKTFSLKLKHRQYLLENSKLSVSAFTLNNLELKFNDKSALQFVLTNLEKEMRKKINPWIGKQ